MASGTINGSTSNEYIVSKIEWTSTPTKSTNSSKVTATLYYKRTNSGYTTYGLGTFGIYIDGKHGGLSATLTITEHEWVKAVTTTKTIAHNDDGTMTIKIYGVGNIGGTTLTSTNCSAQVKLDTIPRESSFTVSTGNTTSAGNPYVVVNDTNSLKVNISSHSASFEHHVRFNFGSKDVEGDLVYNSKTYVPKMEDWLPYITSSSDTFALSDANAPSVEVRTISEEGEQVGETVRKRFDIDVPYNTTTAPSVSRTISPVNPSSVPSNMATLYIQGKSSLNVDLSGSKAKYGASISSYQMRINNGGWYSGSTIKSGTLYQSGSNTITCKVTDSRGHSTTSTNTITVHEYSKPAITSYQGETAIVCERCTQAGAKDDSGTYLRIKAGMKYSKIAVNGVAQNKCAIWYRYKTESASSYSSWATLIAKGATIDYADVILSNIVSSTTTSYIVELYCEDDLGGYARASFMIPTAQITFHLKEGGKGVGVGKYSETDNCLEIAEDWDVTGRVYSLGKGMANIPQSADLNSFKKFGVYNITSNSTAQTLVNRPSDKAGILIVSSGTGDGKQSGTWVYILQRYLTFDGNEYYRVLQTSGNADEWVSSKWKGRSETPWTSIGLSTLASSATVEAGRHQKGCYYRVIDENHVYVAFNCAFTYNGTALKISGSSIPSPYKPARSINAYCPTNGRALARVYVDGSGNVYVDHVQSLSASSDTSSYSVTWIDGYIDYWV